MTSLFNLQVLLKFKYEELFKLKERFFMEWNMKKKCSCCNSLKNINQYNYLICKHLSRAVRKKFIKEEKIIKDLSRTIKKIEVLSKHPQFYEPLANSSYFT